MTLASPFIKLLKVSFALPVLAACVNMPNNESSEGDNPIQSTSANSTSVEQRVDYHNQYNIIGLEDFSKNITTNENTTCMDKDNNKINCHGTGYKIGVVEPGIFNKDDPEMKDKYGEGIDYNGQAFAGEAGKKVPEHYKVAYHATQVATVVAGKTKGIANGAKVIPYNTVEIGSYRTGAPKKGLATVLHHAIENDVLAINNSWGSSSESNSNNANLFTGETNESGRNFTTFLQQSSTTIDLNLPCNYKGKNCNNFPVWIWANGNKGSSMPILSPKKEGEIDADYRKRYNAYQVKLQTWRDEFKKPSHETLYANKNKSLEKFWMSVTGIDNTGKQSSFAMECGDAKKYCLSALATSVATNSINKNTGAVKNVVASGTSFSAPMVSGAFAILKQRFPSLTVQKIRTRILYTASHTLKDRTVSADGKVRKTIFLKDKEGNVVNPSAANNDGTMQIKVGNTIITKYLSNQFGHGVLRMDKALQPIGDLEIPTSSDLSVSKLYSLDSTKILPSAAFGPELKKMFSKESLIILDALEAPFRVSMANLIAPYTSADSVKTFHDKKQKTVYDVLSVNSTIALGYVQSTHIASAQKMGFINTGMNPVRHMVGKGLQARYVIDNTDFVTHMGTNGNIGSQSISHKFYYKGITATPRLSVVLEKNAVLGMTGTAAMAINTHTATTFAGIDVSANLPIGKIYGYVTMGQSYTSDFSSPMIKSIENIKSQALGLYYRFGGFGLGGFSPLRVNTADFTVETSKIDYVKEKIVTEDIVVKIRPTGMERTFESFYIFKHTIGKTRFTAIRTLDKNHTENNNDTRASLQYSVKF